jgi:hypothetical protein
MPWTCQHCHAEVNDELTLCWQCGTGMQGEPPPAGWRSERLGLVDGSERTLLCLRCEQPMSFAGLKQFQSGSYAKEVVLGEFFMHRERMDMYRCDSCGKLEFFAPYGSS